MKEPVVPIYDERSKRTDFYGYIVNFFIVLCFVILISFLIFNYFITVSSVRGTSMNDTLQHKETLLMEKSFKKLKRGDIITITGLSDELIIKRIIALEGDHLVFKISSDELHIEVYLKKQNEEYKKLDEKTYIKEPMNRKGWGLDGTIRYFREEYRLCESDVPISEFDKYEICIKSGECFVMGDNRNDSSDSRTYGLGKIKNITGRLFYRVKKNSILEKILLFIYSDRKPLSFKSSYIAFVR